MRFPSNCVAAPRRGIASLVFGMSLPEVKDILGEPSAPPRLAFGSAGVLVVHWCKNVLALDFAPDLSCVEISRGEGFDPEIDGVHVLRSEVDLVIEALRVRGWDYDRHDPEPGYSFVYPQLDIALWRPVISHDSTEEGRFFSTFAIGREGYFARTA